MKFEWDENKNAANFKRHGLYLDQAIDAFDDPMGQEYYDYKHSGIEEDRFLFVGFANNQPLLIFIYRAGP